MDLIEVGMVGGPNLMPKDARHLDMSCLQVFFFKYLYLNKVINNFIFYLNIEGRCTI